MSILTEISVGEFLDKLCILEIKADRIKEPVKLDHVLQELSVLQQIWGRSPYAALDLLVEVQGLRHVNEQLWEIEDRIRGLESKGEFDSEFIYLARAVYITNDRRAAIKRRINTLAGSSLTEEKSYKDYEHNKFR